MWQRTATTGMGRGQRFREPEGYEGYEVHDPLGQRIGRAEKLFVNGGGDPKHVRVRLGFFGKSVLIPVGGVVADPERRTIVLGSWGPSPKSVCPRRGIARVPGGSKGDIAEIRDLARSW